MGKGCEGHGAAASGVTRRRTLGVTICRLRGKGDHYHGCLRNIQRLDSLGVIPFHKRLPDHLDSLVMAIKARILQIMCACSVSGLITFGAVTAINSGKIKL